MHVILVTERRSDAVADVAGAGGGTPDDIQSQGIIDRFKKFPDEFGLGFGSGSGSVRVWVRFGFGFWIGSGSVWRLDIRARFSEIAVALNGH